MVPVAAVALAGFAGLPATAAPAAQPPAGAVEYAPMGSWIHAYYATEAECESAGFDGKMRGWWHSYVCWQTAACDWALAVTKGGDRAGSRTARQETGYVPQTCGGD